MPPGQSASEDKFRVLSLGLTQTIWERTFRLVYHSAFSQLLLLSLLLTVSRGTRYWPDFLGEPDGVNSLVVSLTGSNPGKAGTLRHKTLEAT